MNKIKVGRYLLIALGVMTILSGITTIFGGLDALLSQWNAVELSLVLGLLKIVGGLLLVFDITRIFGVLWNVAYFGGAMASHVVLSAYDMQFVIAAVLMAALWIGFALTYYHKIK